MSIEDEARAELIRLLFDRMPDTWDENDIGILADEIEEWQASRKVEAAPSGTDRETLEQLMYPWLELDGRASAAHAILAAGFSCAQPVQVEPTFEEWAAEVAAERSRHPEKGYTAEHDRKHGLKHLANWAIDYARCGKGVKSSSMVLALLEAAEPVQVEATDEMVEKAMVAAIQSADIPTGMRGTLLGSTPTIRERVDLDDVVRVVLKAALGGGDHA